jgi:bifunctional non-homologous end joining protein LigD
VSTPVSWQEVERGVRIEDFTIRNVVKRIGRVGDLWKPLLSARGRFNLGTYV